MIAAAWHALQAIWLAELAVAVTLVGWVALFPEKAR